MEQVKISRFKSTLSTHVNMNNSPYYNESHIKVRNAIREWVDKEITPFCHEWSENKEIPKSVLKRAAEVGFLAAVSGAGTNPKMAHLFPYPLPGGVKPEEFDIFHEFICIDELARCGSGGLIWALEGGLAIVNRNTETITKKKNLTLYIGSSSCDEFCQGRVEKSYCS